jgi:exosortase
MSELLIRQPDEGRLIGRADLVIAAGLVIAAFASMFDAWADIYRLGSTHEELSYVLAAPAVIAWLAFGRRENLSECRLRGGWLGLLIMAAAWAIHWYGYLTDPVLWRGSAVMLAVGAVVAALGIDVLWRFLPAFAMTIFLIPISPNGRYFLAAPLQAATAQATQWVCDILGIYVDRFGNELNINGIDVTVAEACSGMRMILTMFLVCFAVAFVLPLRGWVRAVSLAACPLVAIAANVVRLVPTVWVFGHASRKTAEAFHSISGWVMLVVAFIFLLSVFKVLELAGLPVMQAPSQKTNRRKPSIGPIKRNSAIAAPAEVAKL